MVIVQMGEEHKIRRTLLQKIRGSIATVALQKEDTIPQNWVREHTDVPNVYQNCGVTHVVYFDQCTSLFLTVQTMRCIKVTRAGSPSLWRADGMGPGTPNKCPLYPSGGILSIRRDVGNGQKTDTACRGKHST